MLGTSFFVLLVIVSKVKVNHGVDGVPSRARSYYVDPVSGDDNNSGSAQNRAWRTLWRLNRQDLGPGDQVRIASGRLSGSLAPRAIGTKKRPVVIRFESGRHEFCAEGAERKCYFVSNSADAPYEPRPIAILVRGAKHLKIMGEKSSDLVFRDRMTLLINDESEDITYHGLSFDMVRPTVSEFRVLEVGKNHAVVQVAEGSTFAVKDGRFTWTGDLGPGWTMVQEADQFSGKCWRKGKWDPFSAAKATDLGEGKVRLEYQRGNLDMVVGRTYQFRNVTRDTTSGVNTRCRDIVFRDCNFYSLPGMGIVSQFTENVTFQRVDVMPRPGSTRTCAAWADGFHFSGCRGKVLVDACNFSGMQDDPINVHGTFLRIVKAVEDHQVLVRFMHPQTFGFPAFQAGDEVEIVNHLNLRPFAAAQVRSLDRKSDTDWLLTLDRMVPPFSDGDVIDNVSWYPDLTIRNCSVAMDSCRGFLLTTRGKVLVTDNTFHNTAMSAILISDDASSWFESGSVKQVTIQRNRFLQCGDPVVSICPENKTTRTDEPVHSGIRILDNWFEEGGIFARSVEGLRIRGNYFTSHTLPIGTEFCSDTVISRNHIGKTALFPERTQ